MYDQLDPIDRFFTIDHEAAHKKTPAYKSYRRWLAASATGFLVTGATIAANKFIHSIEPEEVPIVAGALLGVGGLIRAAVRMPDEYRQHGKRLDWLEDPRAHSGNMPEPD